MTQKKSSSERTRDETTGRFVAEGGEVQQDIEVNVEGDDNITPSPPQEEDKPPVSEPPKVDTDIEALKQQITELEAARENSYRMTREAEARERQAHQELSSFRNTAEQSQYDALIAAINAAQTEVDSSKRDIMVFGHGQDYAAMADAQERLAAAKTRMVSLEMAKEQYERMKEMAPPPQPRQQDNLLPQERDWLMAHPEAMSEPKKFAKLNAAYFDAMDKGLQRGSREYFNYIEESLGYRQPQKAEVEESPVMVAAPPSKDTPVGTGTGGSKGVYTITREEAEIARASGITPAEYVKQKLELQRLKKEGMYSSQG